MNAFLSLIKVLLLICCVLPATAYKPTLNKPNFLWQTDIFKSKNATFGTPVAFTSPSSSPRPGPKVAVVAVDVALAETYLVYHPLSFLSLPLLPHYLHL